MANSSEPAGMAMDAAGSTSARVDALIDAAPIGALQWRIIALCALAMFLDGYDAQALALAVPSIAADFGVAPAQFGGALSGSLAGMAIGALTLAPLADRFGRRSLLCIILALIGLTTAATAMASTTLVLTGWRFVCGLGMGAVLPVVMTITSEYAPARKRAALIAMVSCAMPLGSAFVGLIAPVIEAWGGWRAIFWAGAIAPCCAALVIRFAMPESWSMLQRRGAEPAVRRQLQQIAPGLASAVLQPIAQSPQQQRGSLQLLWSQYRGLALLFAITSWFNLFASYSLISWAPTLLNLGGVELAQAQRAVGMMAFGAIAGGLFLSWLADRGHMIAGLGAAYAGAAIIFLLYAAGPRNETLWLVLLPLAGATIVGAQTALGAASASFFPAVARSTALGLTSGVGRTGAIIGPLVIAALLQRLLDPITLLGVLTAPMLICAAAIFLLPAILKRTGRGEP